MPQVAEYVTKHNLSEVFEDIVNDVIRDLPENPMQALQGVVRCEVLVDFSFIFRILTRAAQGWLSWEELTACKQRSTQSQHFKPRWVCL